MITTTQERASGRGIDAAYCASFLLRVGLTPNCNYRCTYCNPAGLTGSTDFLDDRDLYELLLIAATLGTRRVHLTGGEPLMRRGLADIMTRVRDESGVSLEYYLTTNGSLLTQKLADALAAAGMRRCNVSVDALSEKRFTAIAGRNQFDHARRGALVAARTFERTKLNMVALRAANLGEFPALVEFCQDNGLVLRLMELLPFSISEQPDEFFLNNHVGKEEMEMLVDTLGSKRRVTTEGNNWACDYWQIDGLRMPIGVVYHHSRGYQCVRSACRSVRVSSTGSVAACYTAGHGTRSIKERSFEDKIDVLLDTFQEKRDLAQGVLPYPRYHLPDYETFRGSSAALAHSLPIPVVR